MQRETEVKRTYKLWQKGNGKKECLYFTEMLSSFLKKKLLYDSQNIDDFFGKV